MILDATTTTVNKWITKVPLFCGLEFWDNPFKLNVTKIKQNCHMAQNRKTNYFKIHNRRYLGNKYKLLWLIEYIISMKCWDVKSFCDIFAWTWVVWEAFNKSNIKVISNDFLYSNYICLKAFLSTTKNYTNSIIQKIDYL